MAVLDWMWHFGYNKNVMDRKDRFYICLKKSIYRGEPHDKELAKPGYNSYGYIYSDGTHGNTYIEGNLQDIG